MTQIPAPGHAKAPRTSPLNTLITSVLLAWVLSWQGILS